MAKDENERDYDNSSSGGNTYEERREAAQEAPGEGSGWTSETDAVDDEDERAEK